MISKSFTPRFVLLAILITCLCALGAAYVGEYIFGLKPCTLCFYQRYAYMSTIGIALTGLFLPQIRQQIFMLFTAAMAFLTNCGIALFQVLVEKKIVDLPGVCKGVPLESKPESFDQFKSSLEAAGNHVPCDIVAWDMFGISMAGYNALFTLLCTLACLTAGAFFYASLSNQKKT